MDPATIVGLLALAGVSAAFVAGVLVPRDHRAVAAAAHVALPSGSAEPDPPIVLEHARQANELRKQQVRLIEAGGCNGEARDHEWEEQAIWSASSWYPVAVYKRCSRCGHDPRRGNVPLPPHVVLYDEDTMLYHLTVPGTREIVLTTFDERLAYEVQDDLEDRLPGTDDPRQGLPRKNDRR